MDLAGSQRAGPVLLVLHGLHGPADNPVLEIPTPAVGNAGNQSVESAQAGLEKVERSNGGSQQNPVVSKGADPVELLAEEAR